ncbi:hypothetical protein DFJ58DRAFT_848665 [Suillus subalutaceus]|uniref:uncharacterized protein n=1 Tax=Suillus subalutaceus TaxID=48586 RepID=UPI001B872555|nr:uncharacterized protein DFJ58DRAFT_848665 [Suillus subalutaceus]KAG1829568.1 hypothetical protein DFJ58DRAFT_848665 [Suillus subalutaceus]
MRVLKTRHPAGRKWTDQFIYLILISKNELGLPVPSCSPLPSILTQMIPKLSWLKITNGRSGHRGSASKLPRRVRYDLSSRHQLFPVRLYTPKSIVSCGGWNHWRPWGLDDVQPAEDEPNFDTQLGLPEESSAPAIQDEYNYEPYNTIDFGASVPSEDILPSASVLAVTSLTAAVSSSTRETGSGLPQNLHAVRNNTPRFSSSRSGFDMLVKPKHNPWDRK